MGDEWDKNGSNTDFDASTKFESLNIQSGSSFGGKGRGFVPVNSNESNNDWGSENRGGFGGERRGRGGGRGGRGGGRGGRFDGDRDGGGFHRRDRDDDGNRGGWGRDNTDGERSDRRGNGGGWGRDNTDGERSDRRGNGGGWGRDNTDGERNDRRNNDGGGNYSRGGGRRNNDRDDDRGGDRNAWGSGDGESRRGGRFNDRDGGDNQSSDWKNNDGGGRGGEEEQDKRPPIYVPKEKTEEELWAESGISKGINFKDYKDIQVNASGRDCPKKINSFSEAQFRDLLLNNIKKCQYDEPTPVQQYAIPIVMNKRDLMATAQTGSGKTAAYLLPSMHMVLNENIEESGGVCAPQILVLAPTRELVIQIHDVAKKFAQGSYLKVRQLYGGTACSYQYKQLQQGCNVLIATPGRLKDFINRNNLNFSGVKFLILDEADRMLDQGFHEDIEFVCSHESMTPKDQRQTLMFSATFSDEVQRLATNYLTDYIFLAIGVIGGACKDVKQRILLVGRNDKKKQLKEILDESSDVRGTLLFVGTKRTADFIATYLSSSNFPTTSIHGDRFQSQREEALRDFRMRKMSILVATSVAARGLDISGVKHVINYDLPDSVDEYVHRIGRTGRLGNQGLATSFYDSDVDHRIAKDLVRILKQAGQEVPPFLDDAAAGSAGFSQDDSFGGYDYREKSNDDKGFKTSSVPTPHDTSDNWD